MKGQIKTASSNSADGQRKAPVIGSNAGLTDTMSSHNIAQPAPWFLPP